MEEIQKVMKYKVGDIVRIRWDLKPGDKSSRSRCSVNTEMPLYKGEYAIIQGIDENGSYVISVDGGVWRWRDEFFIEDLDASGYLATKIIEMKARLKEIEDESVRIKNELISIKNALNEI